MKENYKRLFAGYYILILMLGLYNLVITVFGLTNFIQSYQEYIANGFSIFNYFIFLLSSIIFISSIFLIILIYRRKLPKINLIAPIYYMFYYLVWSFLTVFLVRLYYGSEIIAIETAINLSKYDIIFFILHIVLPSYFLYRMYKKNEKID